MHIICLHFVFELRFLCELECSDRNFSRIFLSALGKFELESLSSEILMYSRRILCAASLNVSVSFTKAVRNGTTQRYRILIIMLRNASDI